MSGAYLLKKSKETITRAEAFNRHQRGAGTLGAIVCVWFSNSMQTAIKDNKNCGAQAVQRGAADELGLMLTQASASHVLKRSL